MSTKQKIGAFVILTIAFIGSGILEKQNIEVQDASHAAFEETMLSLNQ